MSANTVEPSHGEPTGEAANLPTRTGLITRLGFGLALAALALSIDEASVPIAQSLALFERWGELRETLMAVKLAASGWGALLIGLVIAGLDRWSWRRAAVLWLVVVVAGVTGSALKVAVGRERPTHENQLVGGEVIAVHGPAGGARTAYCQSFPSGHTMAAFATATALSAFYPQAAPLFFGVASAAGVERLVHRQHFLSDVVAGAFLGNVVGLMLLSRRRIRRWWSDESAVLREGRFRSPRASMTPPRAASRSPAARPPTRRPAGRRVDRAKTRRPRPCPEPRSGGRRR